MKRDHILFLSLGIIILCFCSCDKDDKEEAATYPAPVWSIKDNPEYATSMTAILRLPDDLEADADQEDELAAFMGGDCCGVGERIGHLYYVLIKGTSYEQSEILFRYYSSKNKYLYESSNTVTFEIDNVYGTTDEPVVLSLIIQ